MDEHAEPVDPNDNYGTTKRQLFQMLSDVLKLRKLAALNLAEDERLNPKVPLNAALATSATTAGPA